MAKVYGVTTQEIQSNDKRIGIIKENAAGSFQYSTDGLTFKTVSGGSSVGAKGFDFVVAPADSGVTNADLVLTGTDDQIALNKFLTDTVSKVTSHTPAVKFLGGTVNLNGDLNITGHVYFISDKNTKFNFTEYAGIILLSGYPNFKGFTFSKNNGSVPIIYFTSQPNNMLELYDCRIDCPANTSTPCIACDCIMDSCSGVIGTITATNITIKNSTFKTPPGSITIGGESSKLTIVDSIISEYSDNPSDVGLESSIKLNGSECNLKNTRFNYEISSSNGSSDNSFTVKIAKISYCTFNGNLDINSNIVSSGFVENCSFSNGPTSITNIGLVDNCEFNYDVTLKVHLLKNCEFNGGSTINNINTANVCDIDSCTFNNGITTKFNVHSCINCDFSLNSIDSRTADKFINCRFVANYGNTIETLVKSDFIDNCIFNNISTSSATDGLIQSKNINTKSTISNCTFDGITFIPSEEGMYNYSIINGFTSVTNCNFQKISITKNDSDSIFISNVKSVRGIYVGENITGNHIVIFDGSQESISNVQTFASSKNLSFLSTQGMAADGFKITLSNIYMKYGLDMYFLGDYAKIDGLTVDHYEVDNDHNKLINVFSINSNDKHFEFSNMSVDMSSGMTNLASKLIDITVGSSKLFLKLSNIYWKNNGLSHSEGASDSFPSNILVDTDSTFTPEANQPGKYQVICDNVTIIDNGGVAITNKKLSAYLNDKLSQFLMYSNYTISGYNPDVPVTTVNNTLNYSSNAAVKYENGKPYMYTGTDWVELQIKS